MLYGLPLFVKYDLGFTTYSPSIKCSHVLVPQEPQAELKEEPEAEVKKRLSETFYYDYLELISTPYVSSPDRIPLYFLALKYPLQLYTFIIREGFIS